MVVKEMFVSDTTPPDNVGGKFSRMITLDVKIWRYTDAAKTAQMKAKEHRLKIPFRVRVDSGLIIKECLNNPEINWSIKSCSNLQHRISGFNLDGSPICVIPLIPPATTALSSMLATTLAI
ncbi:MAG: hypothetical protein WCG27_03155, partial [Pseudomonadota bacterium]